MNNSICISLLMTKLIISEVHTSLIWVTISTVPPKVLCTDNTTQKLISNLEIKEKSLSKCYKLRSFTVPQVKLFSHTKVHLKVIIWDSWYLNSLQVPISCHSKHLKIKEFFIKHNDQTNFRRLWRALSFIEHVTSH